MLGGLAAGSILVSTAFAATTRSVCPSGCTYPTIQSAIDAAGADDLIQIGKGRYVEILNTEGKKLTLQGSGRTGVILDGNGKGTVITIAGTKLVTISDVTITRGFGDGGGIAVRELGQLSLRHCVVVSNHSTTDGGGVNWTGFEPPQPTTLSINDCSITGNDAARAGGGLNVNEEAVAVNIRNSTFSRNSAQQGGAISLGTDFIHATITQTSIVDNTASDTAGGLFFGTFGGSLVADDSVVIANNSARNQFGGVLAGASDTKPRTTVSISGWVLNNAPDNCNPEARCQVVSQTSSP
jgi:predicted outer membrane repeat protein